MQFRYTLFLMAFLSFGLIAPFSSASHAGVYCDCLESERGGSDWDGAMMDCETGNLVRWLFPTGGSSQNYCLNSLKDDRACPGTCQNEFYCDCIPSERGGGDWDGAIIDRATGNLIRRLLTAGATSKTNCLANLRSQRTCQ